MSAVQFETTLLVTWTPPTTGNTATGYVVYYEPSGNSDSSRINNSSASQLTLSISEVGVVHSVTIVTLSNHLPSTAVTVISKILQAPNQPTFLSAVHQIPTSITVYWTAPTGTITKYEITLQSREGSILISISTPVSVSDDVSSYVIDSGVSADVDYSASILALNIIAHSSITGPVFAARGEMSVVYVYSIYCVGCGAVDILLPPTSSFCR